MAEFKKEIAHSGGRIEFNYDNGGLSQSFSHLSPTACSMFQVCISYQGELLDFVPIRGMGVSVPYPQPSICAFVISDQVGMFGRSCPKCKSYFRVNNPSRYIYCPYCKIKANNIKFATDNQKEFLTAYYNTLISAVSEKKSITIDLDEQADKLSDNTPKWVYKEQQQQTLHKCESCNTHYDILGEYGCCPCCGELNALVIINKRFSVLDGTAGDPAEILKQSISEFEAMAKDVKSCLVLLPGTPKRKKEVDRLNFQRIFDTNEKLVNWFGVDILKGLKDKDRVHINRMFQRRHLLTHNGGRVDQKYLDETNDTKVRLHQTICVTEEEVKMLIEILKSVSANLVEGWKSITSHV